mgnify:CR=1 FL=1
MYNNQRIIKELTPYIPAVEIFRIYEREPGAAFLDSSLVNELGHYSVIGRCPYLKLVKDGKTFTINGKPETETTFEDYMREYLNTHEDKNDSRLPLVSGAVGYFSYDYGRKQMGVLRGKRSCDDSGSSSDVFMTVLLWKTVRKKGRILCQMESAEMPRRRSAQWKKQSWNLQRLANRKNRKSEKKKKFGNGMITENSHREKF